MSLSRNSSRLGVLDDGLVKARLITELLVATGNKDAVDSADDEHEFLGLGEGDCEDFVSGGGVNGLRFITESELLVYVSLRHFF